MTTPPIKATALFFDDIRMEITGKSILIGQYIGDMYIADTITPIDRIAILLDVRWPRDYQPKTCAIRVEIPSQPEPIIQNLPPPTPPDYSDKPVSPFAGATMQGILQLRFPPLRVGDHIDVWFQADGHDFPAGRLTLSLPKPHPLNDGMTPSAAGI